MYPSHIQISPPRCHPLMWGTRFKTTQKVVIRQFGVFSTLKFSHNRREDKRTLARIRSNKIFCFVNTCMYNFITLFQSNQTSSSIVFCQCHHVSLMDFVVSPPSCGRSVTDFWGWDAHEAQLRCPDEVDGDMWIWSTRRGLKPKFY
jgi:hypothetical protein